MAIENFNLTDVAQEMVSVSTKELAQIVYRSLKSELAVTTTQVMEALEIP